MLMYLLTVLTLIHCNVKSRQKHLVIYMWLLRGKCNNIQETLTGLSSRQCARIPGITVCFYMRDIGYGTGLQRRRW